MFLLLLISIQAYLITVTLATTLLCRQNARTFLIVTLNLAKECTMKKNGRGIDGENCEMEDMNMLTAGDRSWRERNFEVYQLFVAKKLLSKVV